MAPLVSVGRWFVLTNQARAATGCPVVPDSRSNRPLAQVGRQPHLMIIQGDVTGRAYRLNRGTTSIGRYSRCDIVLPYSTWCSWHHASVIKRGDGIAVRDLGSRNGTFVGLDRVTHRELTAGDIVRFGDRVALQLVFLDVPPPS